MIQGLRTRSPDSRIEKEEQKVTGEQMKAIQMIPGYTHNIINLSKTHDLVTVMWANEIFNPNKPDTFGELVQNN